MITVKIKDGVQDRSGAPHIVAAFSFRYDHQLVPSLIANIEPMVDGWISYDDREATVLYSSEPERRRLLIEAALEVGASWLLAVDPDERIEAGFAKKIRRLTRTRRPTAFVFNLRELYAPDAYRIDGIWGQKKIARLVSLHEGMVFDVGALHSSWHELYPRYRLRSARTNIYHLKMLTSERRNARRSLYEALDPERALQRAGYEYLTDESALVLCRIPRKRGFRPPHVEDHGLWMPPVSRLADEKASSGKQPTER